MVITRSQSRTSNQNEPSEEAQRQPLQQITNTESQSKNQESETDLHLGYTQTTYVPEDLPSVRRSVLRQTQSGVNQEDNNSDEETCNFRMSVFQRPYDPDAANENLPPRRRAVTRPPVNLTQRLSRITGSKTG